MGTAIIWLQIEASPACYFSLFMAEMRTLSSARWTEFTTVCFSLVPLRMHGSGT